MKTLQSKTKLIPTVRPIRLISSYRDTLCFAQGTSLTCVNQVSTTENIAGPLFRTETGRLVLDPYVVGSTQVEGVGWRNEYGQVSYYDFNTGGTQIFDILSPKFEIGQGGLFSAIVYRSQTSFLQTNDISTLVSGEGYTDFVRGRGNNGWICTSNSTALSCTIKLCVPSPTVICPTLTAYEPLASFTSLTLGASMPVLDMLSGLYIASGQPYFLGVPNCAQDPATARPEFPQSLSSCSVLVPSGQNVIPTLAAASQVSLGNWGACAIIQGGSLSCWSNVVYPPNPPWEAYQSVTYIQVNNTGACVQYIDTDMSQKVRCWGTPYLDGNNVQQTASILVHANQTVSSPVYFAGLGQPTFSCSVSDVLFSNTCFACPYGSSLVFGDSYPLCTPCSSSTPVRGIGQSACISCGLGSQSSLDYSVCERCPLNSINSISGSLSCLECPPGFQGSDDRLSCLACSTFLADSVREAGAPECHVCLLPSYSEDPTQRCFSCPLPQFPSLTLGSTKCIACNVGSAPNLGGSCTQCIAPYVRSSAQLTCTLCLPGTEANASLTACLPCTGNTFRSVALQCTECATGTLANADHSACIAKPLKSGQFLSQGQTVLMAVGIALVMVSFGASSKLTPPQVILGVLVGLSIATGSYFLV